MYTHILIAIDGSELAQRGLDHGLSLAKLIGGKVTILTVSEPIPAYAFGGGFGGVGVPIDFEAYRQSGKETAERILADAKASAVRVGVAAETVYVEERRPAEAIVETATERDCNLIVMASHGRRGLGRLFLGSQTIETLTFSPVPVLVVR
ncbi:universal stress protein [Pseudaminobacter sp. 19-2017]|uniref:Universal stress protein n=1 Tax=Pseudaminobacter soli (ex Zhang et al. 2022) TaxID=2831468 RepID=A0A942EAQ9_9HYPH|nr:universal stress protein [Pseudaminobacter soli]MBS3651597.1 universal stress protein [Pseudaminobacter soli]